MLFEDVAREYMAEKRNRLRANTIEGYESALRKHLMPRWKGRNIDDVDEAEIQDWIDSFDLPGAAEKAFKTLRQIIRWCIRRYHLKIWDPTINVELPKKRPYRPLVLSARDEKSMLRGMWGAPAHVEAVVLIGACLGARRGESCAVDLAKDIDWRTGEVRLGKSLQVVGGTIKILPPKTDKSDRRTVLPRFALRRLKQLFPPSRRAGLISGGFRPDAIARAIKSWCKSHSMPYVPQTQLRHTWATLAIEAGVGIETVSMMLGHTDIGTAYEHYIVPRLSICKDAQMRVEKLLKAA